MAMVATYEGLDEVWTSALLPDRRIKPCHWFSVQESLTSAIAASKRAIAEYWYEY